jgi:hypothetical protein
LARDDLCGSVDAALDAVGDARAAVGRAGEVEAGMRGYELIDFVDECAVADVVLRVRFRPAVGAGEHRRCGDTHDVAELAACDVDEGSFILLGEVFREGAADEDAHEDVVVWRAVAELGR